MDDIKVIGNKIFVNGVDRTPWMDRSGRDVRPLRLFNDRLYVTAHQYHMALDFAREAQIPRNKVVFADSWNVRGMRGIPIYCIGRWWHRQGTAEADYFTNVCQANGHEMIEVYDWR